MIPDEEIKKEFASRAALAEWLERTADRAQRLAAQRERRARLRPRHAAAADAGVRLHDRNACSSCCCRWCKEKRDPRRLDGQRLRAGGAPDKPRMLYDYFKQLFAQVTNPPIDSIREEVIMSLECYIGPEANLLETTREHATACCCRIRSSRTKNWRRSRTSTTAAGRRRRSTSPSAAKRRRSGLEDGDRSHLPRKPSRRSTTAVQLVVLSDRGVGPDRVPISSLLACGAVHHHLIRQAKRTRIGIVSKRARRAKCITTACWSATARTRSIRISRSKRCGRRSATACCRRNTSDEKIVHAYRKAVAKGMLKVMAKMGISTLQSTRARRSSKRVGLTDEVIDAASPARPAACKA